MDNWFEELSLMRKRFDDSVQENKFDKGIRHSTVEKYPDPVHFVFELLQNAEDQGATESQFVLTPDALVFRHNGKSFTRADVENITGIGNSEKAEEANKIGRFGIGFKAVFAITDRPEIYTLLEGNPFAFAIDHLVVPIVISGISGQSNHYTTQFSFPFIIGQERVLYSKIREKLSTLGFETMLFLQNLASIEWQTKTANGVYLHKVQGSRHELFGESQENGLFQERSANYLIFTRNVSLSDNERGLDVRVAFRLDEKGKIIAEPGQKLAVYFPTEQTTGLNMRLHGPFLLTDNRANIKNDNDTNTRLIQEFAVLLAESMQLVKEAGLLTVDFLSLLPIRKDHIPNPFHPLYDQVFQALKQHSLLPTANGTFVSAAYAKLARSTELRSLINETQLSTLYKSPSSLHWLSADITLDKTPDLYRYLFRDLEIENVDAEAFVRKLENTFLEKQTDEWMVQLYIFLSKQPGLNYIIKGKPILRLEDNSHKSPFSPPYDRNTTPNAYLLREGESKFALVKRALLTDDKVYDFLKRMGLSEPDIVDEVLKFILPPYLAHEIAFDDELRNKRDLETIQEALQRTGYRARLELFSKLKETPFIRASNAKTAEQAWKTPGEVYRQTEELLTWFEGNETIWFISEPFLESLFEDLNIRTHLQPSASMAMATGSMEYIVIHDWHGNHQRGLHRFDPGANLEGLQHALNFITLNKARILWNILLEHRHLIKGIVETSTQQNFSNSRTEEKISQIGKLCSQETWLPGQIGKFCFPDELFLTDLPDEFEKSTDEARDLAIKLGMRKAETLQLADKLGIPHELIPFIQHNLAVIQGMYQKQEQIKISLPSSITIDPTRRIAKATELAYNAGEKSYKSVTMNRRISAATIEPRNYLRLHHTNIDDQLICQLCNQTMPFRLLNGEEFFVACQYLEPLDKENEANHLALCPNCAAEFQYACQTDEDERSDLILDLDPTVNEANLIVHIDMPVHQCLRFTQRHLIDLQAAIKDFVRDRLVAD